MTICAFYRHGMAAESKDMAPLARSLARSGKILMHRNKGYKWRDPVVDSGLELAQEVANNASAEDILLVGHSQGGLVCRVAAVALDGTLRPGMNGLFTRKIQRWRQEHGISEVGLGKLAVVTIATPNAGAITFGQMSNLATLLGWSLATISSKIVGLHNLEDLTTPRLFQEFEGWTVGAKYLSISGTAVSRYNRGWVQNALELVPTRRVSVRFDLPNDEIVEDSSTDLRQSLIRPEVDLASRYRHVRAYPGSIRLNHSTVRKSPEVVDTILENLDWLFA